MHAMPNWNLDATSSLTRRELAAVLADLKARRSMNARRNLKTFRLACCWGLRVLEISQICLAEVVSYPRPRVSLPAPTRTGKPLRRAACLTTYSLIRT